MGIIKLRPNKKTNIEGEKPRSEPRSKAPSLEFNIHLLML